jgi:hypothetical protein
VSEPSALPPRLGVALRVLAICALAASSSGCRSVYATQLTVSVDTDLSSELSALRIRVLHGCSDGGDWLGSPDGRLPSTRAALPDACVTFGEGRSQRELVPVLSPGTGAPAGSLEYQLVLDRVMRLPGSGLDVPECGGATVTALPITITVLPPAGEPPCDGGLPFVVAEVIGIPRTVAARPYYAVRQARFARAATRTLAVFLTDCVCDVGSTCDAIGRCVPVGLPEADAGVGGGADGGVTVPGCVEGYDDCDRARPGCETELATDPLHCGRCDSACPDGQRCVSSSCSIDEFCPSGLLRCGELCVDPASSDEHCGRCDAPCVSGRTASASASRRAPMASSTAEARACRSPRRTRRAAGCARLGGSTAGPARGASRSSAPPALAVRAATAASTST